MYPSTVSTLDQKKNQQQGTENAGTSPNNIKKPDIYGFAYHFFITVVPILFYVGIIGSIGMYTTKTVSGKQAQNCTAEMYLQTFAQLKKCRQLKHKVLAESAKTSAIANYFSQVLEGVFSLNTSFIDKYSYALSATSNIFGPNLSNGFGMMLYSILIIPLFIGIWVFNWFANGAFALIRLPTLMYDKISCSNNKNEQCWNDNRIHITSYWKIIPIFCYLPFIALTSFFSAFYTTFGSIISPLIERFDLNGKNYGFKYFLLDMISTNKWLWLIIFAVNLISSSLTYLGDIYAVAAAIALLVAYWKL